MYETIKDKNAAIDILSTYSGENPYILTLKRNVSLQKKVKELTPLNVEYILKNKNFTPLPMNKSVEVTDWYAEKLKEKWDIEFLPKVIVIKCLLGETDQFYHCLIKYRKNMEPIYAFLPKKGLYGDILLEDYHNLIVDFDRYDKLFRSRHPNDEPRYIKPHQKEAVQFLLSRKKCILADSMGMGKTTSLTVASIEGNFDSVLIICPASLKTNWFNELSFYIPEREISIIGGVNEMNKPDLERYLGYSIGRSNKTVSELKEEAKSRGKWVDNRYVIINYDILDDVYKIPESWGKEKVQTAFEQSPMLQFLKDKKSLIIIDEAHLLSNITAGRYKIIKDLIKRSEPHSIYLSTGTPITNSPENYFNLLSIIGDSITLDREFYFTRYCNAFRLPINDKEKEKKKRLTEEFCKERGKSNWYELTDKEKDDLNAIINVKVKQYLIPKGANNLEELQKKTSHIYLRRVKEDLGTLPPKFCHERIYELTKEQQAEYERLWEEYEKEKMQENPDKDLNKDLLEGSIYRQYLSIQMIPHTIALVNKCLERDEKVVIACCYDEELYTLRDYFGDKCVIYNGKMSLKEKDNAKDLFMTDPNIKVFIGNIRSCGVGITLTSSRIVIYNNISFSPAEDRQMEDRCYRIGQKRDVHIFYQIFKNTQYEKMWNTVLRKEMIINQVIKKEDEKI